jgi:hypothetical protein
MSYKPTWPDSRVEPAQRSAQQAHNGWQSEPPAKNHSTPLHSLPVLHFIARNLQDSRILSWRQSKAVAPCVIAAAKARSQRTHGKFELAITSADVAGRRKMGRQKSGNSFGKMGIFYTFAIDR